MRKDCKKLRYLLELHSYQSKKADKTISELEKIQDMLGSIRDNDIAITHLRRIKHHSKEVSHDMITQRAHKYDEFVEFYRDDLSYSKQNFSQIWTFT
jgi:CHAD domain-containing protein